MIANLPFLSEEKELAFNENCELYEIRRDLTWELVCKGRLSISNISIKISDFEMLFDRILRVNINFNNNLTFSTRESKSSQYELRCDTGYAAKMYLEIMKRYKGNK